MAINKSKFNKLSKKLEEIRDEAIIYLFEQGHTVQDIGEILELSTSAVYNIIKEHREKQTNQNN